MVTASRRMMQYTIARSCLLRGASCMPYLELSSDIRLYYEIDDWTDPWTRPETVVMIHGFTECTEAWRAWVAASWQALSRDPLRSARLRPLEPGGQRFHLYNRAAGRQRGADNQPYCGRAGARDRRQERRSRRDRARRHAPRPREDHHARLDAARPAATAGVDRAHGTARHAQLGTRDHGSASGQQNAAARHRLVGGNDGANRPLDRAGVLRWVSTIDVAPDLSRVQCPALVLTTTAPQRAYSRSDLEVYREGLARAEVVAIPIDGYHVSGSAPDECARIALDFLERHRITTT